MLGRGQPGRSRRGQCPRHGGARTPRLTHGRPSGRGTRRGKRQNRCSAQAARGPALLRRSRRLRPPPRRSSRPRQRPGGGRKSQALGSCLIGLVLVFSATPPVAGRVAPLQPPPPLRFSGCGMPTSHSELSGTSQADSRAMYVLYVITCHTALALHTHLVLAVTLRERCYSWLTTKLWRDAVS